MILGMHSSAVYALGPLRSRDFLVTFPGQKNDRTSVELLSNLLHFKAIGTASLNAGLL
jgi:hypothetical protein